MYPTLCDLAGLPKPAHLQGTSLVPALQNPGVRLKKTAFSQYPKRDGSARAMRYSLRNEQYRMTIWVSQEAARRVLDVDLFDHRTDDTESYSVARELSPAQFQRIAREMLENAGYKINGYRSGPDVLEKLLAWKAANP